MFQKILLVSLALIFAGCASKPFLEKDEIKVTRDEPSKSCHDMGAIEGRLISSKGTHEQALEALKEEAVKKGANFVKMETIGAMGTSVRGRAYHCP